MKKKVLGYYDYTVILTYCGMLFAFAGILRVIRGNYWEAVFCLMFAGVCDMFDGTVAATKDRTEMEKRFGIQIDSFSDLISFGVLPGLFVYMISNQNLFVGILSSLFVLCTLIRLSYFNVLEEERQRHTDEGRKSYIGVPVTTMAVSLPLFYLLYDYRLCKTVLCFPLLLVFMGAGFLSPIEIRKPGVAGKACLILVGIVEMLGMLMFMGWDMV
ncbi:MAG: phosphatidylserine synthase [Lachnospiraceae bacterium]|jgi:Phosphatidylserine synthase|uniref:CDP-alcohol phosphatidyltransferase family protein n=1 Tax=Roseburia sp. 1XD42-69 TaxID=2320088 RepID=UPI000EA07B60|nr:CDP-alcohol phosphatidyltransferase family protein [Roseburia sp. 1XD42-69]MCI8876024.1 phosphatidylserine synthase [Lachnospiraceae bacterium]RKJ64388.1 phosphatidylserine synthase [Roseburia sp. 1XD42-69]